MWYLPQTAGAGFRLHADVSFPKMEEELDSFALL